MKARAAVRDVGRVMEMPISRSRPGRQADSEPARDDARHGARGEPGARRPREDATSASTSCSQVARRLEGMTRHASVHAAGVVIAPQAADRVRAALPQPEGRRRNHDAVGDEGDRARRPAQDGLPRPEHADAARRRRQAHQGDDRRRHRPRRSCRSTTRRPIRSFRTARRTASSSSRARACATRCARPSRSASKT